MNKAIIMFVMLLGSFTYAQTFDFDCIDPLRYSRQASFEDLSTDEVIVYVTFQPGGENNSDSTIFTVSNNGEIVHQTVIPSYIEDWDSSIVTTYLIIIGNHVNSAIAANAAAAANSRETRVAFIKSAAASATTNFVTVSFEARTNDDNVNFTDALGNWEYTLNSSFLNGQKFLEDATQEEVDAWPTQWATSIAAVEAFSKAALRDIYVDFIDAEISTITSNTGVPIEQSNPSNYAGTGDAVVLLNEDGSVNSTIQFNGLLEDKSEFEINHYLELVSEQAEAIAKEIATAANEAAYNAALSTNTATSTLDREAELEALSRDGISVVVTITISGYILEFHDANGLISEVDENGYLNEEKYEYGTSLGASSSYDTLFNIAVTKVRDLVRDLINN